MFKAIKTVMLAWLCFASTVVWGDYFSEVVNVAQKMGVQVEVLDVSKLGVNASSLEMGLLYFSQATGTPLAAHKVAGDSVCKVVINRNVDNEIWTDVGLREMAIAHEVTHCADFSRFSPRGRASTLHGEEMADLGAMFYIKKNKTQEEAKVIINKFYRMRQQDKNVDVNHPDGQLFVVHGDLTPATDYVAQANDLVEHSLFDKVVELF